MHDNLWVFLFFLIFGLLRIHLIIVLGREFDFWSGFTLGAYFVFAVYNLADYVRDRLC